MNHLRAECVFLKRKFRRKFRRNFRRNLLSKLIIEKIFTRFEEMGCPIILKEFDYF
jgi:hypothetical protein